MYYVQHTHLLTPKHVWSGKKVKIDTEIKKSKTNDQGTSISESSNNAKNYATMTY